jgi:C-terminal processing protease CtpA/Prc
MRPVKVEFLSELMDKRNQIMGNKRDEYIKIPSQREPVQENKISDSIGRLNETVKYYFEKQTTQKMRRTLCGYGLFLVSVSGLLVLNDYIIITYFV